jgi:hypothetical protein
MNQAAELALKSLITVAQGHSGQSGTVADFLLSWWNAEECGGFDMTRLWSVDTVIAEAMVMVFGLVAETHSYRVQDDRIERPHAYSCAFGSPAH